MISSGNTGSCFLADDAETNADGGCTTIADAPVVDEDPPPPPPVWSPSGATVLPRRRFSTLRFLDGGRPPRPPPLLARPSPVPPGADEALGRGDRPSEEVLFDDAADEEGVSLRFSGFALFVDFFLREVSGKKIYPYSQVLLSHNEKTIPV